ncbi:MAG: 4Fe-4S binding protein [Synergistaceae bacterium]|nr:4Fe-4S binding protein [Synergistaceae bacterium]
MGYWKKIRYGIMIGFLLFLTWVGYRHQVLGGGPAGVPPVDALCPLGGLESLYTFLRSGTWLRRTAPSAMVLFASVALVTLLFGRVFCGWICPLGTIGELTARGARKLGIRPRELPPSVDRPLKGLKYIILAVILYFTWTLGTLAWRPWDPWVSWMHLSAGWDEIVSSPWGYVVLFLLVIGAGVFIERFWCRYLCPLGAALGILQKLSLTKVTRNKETCITCGKCNKACPMGLEPLSVKRVTEADCISCGRCIEACPVEKTLFFSFGRKKVLSALAVGLLGVGLFFAAYGTARLTGHWQTFAPQSAESLKDPVDGVFGWMTVEQTAAQVKLVPSKVLEIAGLPADSPLDVSLKKMEGVNDEELKEKLRVWFAARPATPAGSVPVNPDEIKGSLTLDDVAAGYGLTGPEILAKAGWPADTAGNIPLKDAAKAIGRETSDIRTAVKELLQEK